MAKKNDLSMSVVVDDLQTEARRYSLVASASDRAELIQRFKILALDLLEADVDVRVTAKPDTIWISGTIKASLTQQCIVTLGEVPETIDEHFELMLVSPEIAEQYDEDELYADPDAADYDAFEGEVLPLGEIVAQTLSVMMDPYPRRPGAEIKPVASKDVSINEEVQKKPNPFSVLSKLQDKS